MASDQAIMTLRFHYLPEGILVMDILNRTA
jgi:hypothetical protein